MPSVAVWRGRRMTNMYVIEPKVNINKKQIYRLTETMPRPVQRIQFHVTSELIAFDDHYAHFCHLFVWLFVCVFNLILSRRALTIFPCHQHQQSTFVFSVAFLRISYFSYSFSGSCIELCFICTQISAIRFVAPTEKEWKTKRERNKCQSDACNKPARTRN